MPLRPVLNIALTLAIGALGGGLAELVGLPAGWLVGATLAVTGAALAKAPVRLPLALRNVAFGLIGLSMGSRASSETLALALQWPLSFVGLLLSVAVGMATSVLYLERVHGQDRATAILATSPGAMAVAAALIAAGYGNASQVVVIQSIRLLALTAAVPLLIGFAPGAQEAASPAIPLVSGGALVILITLSFALGMLLQLLRVPAAYLMGGMAVGLASHLTEIIPGVLPNWLLVPAFIITGSVIGARFKTVSLSEIRSVSRAALVVFALSSAVSAGFALLVAVLLDQPFGQVWIAYAPGAVEAMAAMALTFDFDATYVASHHILRILLLGITMSWLLARIGPPPNSNF